MANDVMRIAKEKYIIQTPNFWFPWFPIEPHSQLPFFHFYPFWLQGLIIFIFPGTINEFEKGTKYNECVSISKETQILSKQKFLSLFENVTILNEYFCKLTKSYVIISDKVEAL